MNCCEKHAPISLSQKVPSTLADVEALCLKVRGLLQGYGLSEICFDVEILARESLVNAVVHGNRNSPDKQVSFGLCVGRKWIRLQIEDEGAGFAWKIASHKRSRTTTASGRGMQIYTLYADRVRFNRTGNQITLWIWKTRHKERKLAQ